MTAVDQILNASLAWAFFASAVTAGVLVAAGYGIRRGLRALHRRAARPPRRANWQTIPAAPDNTEGSDTDALWTCRRIGAAGTANRKH
jgi:hypothetical protein